MGNTAYAGQPLNNRELDILRLMSQGMRNVEIADDLHISYDTVKTYISTLFTKMAVRNRLEAVMKGIALELLHCPCPTHFSQSWNCCCRDKNPTLFDTESVLINKES